MEKLIPTLIIIILSFLSSCNPTLSEKLYQSPDEILFQQWGNYLPNGWRTGMVSNNYPGILAVVNNELVFDAQGPGSKPWMTIIAPFKIERNEIVKIQISEELALKRKIITVTTEIKSFHFYLQNADEIYGKLIEWSQMKID